MVKITRSQVIKFFDIFDDDQSIYFFTKIMIDDLKDTYEFYDEFH